MDKQRFTSARLHLEEENRKLQADAKATKAQKDALLKRQQELEAQSKQKMEHYEAELARLKRQNQEL